MNYYLLNTDLEVIDVIETYKSLIWSTRYFTPGDFELYVAANDKMLNSLKRDYYIVRDDDLTQAMIIDNIQITTDVENGNYLIVTGKSLKSILGRRIIWTQTNLTGNVETAIRKLVTDNVINPSVATRKINNMILGAAIGATGTINAQYTGDNLGDVIQNLCRVFGLGYDVLLDLDDKKFIFILYAGVDRSYNQTTNNYVVFSPEFDNLLTSAYLSNRDSYKNVAMVAGEGEGTARKTTTVGTAAGLNRYEMYVDARDISSNDGEITTTNYNKLLLERGNEKLKETAIIETIDGEVISGYTYKLGTDYFLGDIVEVINEYGIEKTPRITEIIESEDETGHFIIPTFASDDEL